MTHQDHERDERELKALFDATADEPSGAQLTKLRARAADVPARGRRPRWLAWAPVFAVAAGALAVFVLRGRVEEAPVAGSEALAELGNACAAQLFAGPGAATGAELLSQKNPLGSGTLQELYDSIVNRIREKIVVNRVVKAAGPVGVYVHHDGKTAVVFQAEGTPKDRGILRDVAMHIAAMKPVHTLPEQVDPAQVKEERNRLAAEARATGKPENIIEKIVDGRMGVFYRDVAGVLT